MKKQELFLKLKQELIIAVLRGEEVDKVTKMVESIVEGRNKFY